MIATVREDMIEIRGTVISVCGDIIGISHDTGEASAVECANGARFFRKRIAVLCATLVRDGRHEHKRAIREPVVLPPLTDDIAAVMASIGDAMRARGMKVDVDRMLADLVASRSDEAEAPDSPVESERTADADPYADLDYDSNWT